jgi:cytochrome c oxidase cbb3-type subunit I/II
MTTSTNEPAGTGTANPPTWHRRLLEGKAALFATLATVAISIGGIVEIVPMFALQSDLARAHAEIAPYTPLEVAGRDVYVREGCYNCHSQMIRPFRAETLRYGPWTRAEEYVWDRPFQLGSRRIGPDLQRIGGKYPNAWHWEHMKDPRSTSPGSMMPSYPWLFEQRVDPADVQASVKALQRLGTPYSDEEIEAIPRTLFTQARDIVMDMRAMRVVDGRGDLEVVALIAYLQRLGTDGRAALVAREANATAPTDTAPAVAP